MTNIFRTLLARSVREALPVSKVRASRARYISPDIQRVEIEFEVDEGRLTLDLHPSQALQLINELSSAYTAINPPLPPRARG